MHKKYVAELRIFFIGDYGSYIRWGSKPFPKGEEDSLSIRTPARLLGATLLKDQAETYTPVAAPEGQTRHLHLVVAKGKVSVNGVELDERDGAAIKDEASLTITALEEPR